MDNYNNSNGNGFNPGVAIVNNPMAVFDKANAIIGQAMGYGNSTNAMSQSSNQGEQFGQYQDNQQQQWQGNPSQNDALLRAADVIIDQRAREFARGNQPSFLRDIGNVQSNVGNGQANTQNVTPATTTQADVTVKSDLFGSLFGDSTTQQTTGNGQQQSTQQGQQAPAPQTNNNRAMPDETAMFSRQLEEYNSGIAKFAMQNGRDPQVVLDAVSKLTPQQMAQAAMDFLLQGNLANNQSRQPNQQQGNGMVDPSTSMNNQYKSIVNAPKPQYEPQANRSSFFGSGSSLQI